VRGEVRHPHVRQDQEPGVADDEMETCRSGRGAPADVGVAWRTAPRRCREPEGAERSRGALEEVAQLRAGKGDVALTWRRLSFSPKLSRRTSRILRMATRGLGNCCSSDGIVRGACRARPTARQLLRVSPQRVYENVGIGARIRSERVYGSSSRETSTSMSGDLFRSWVDETPLT
jgi:hypothetical protein